MKIQEYLSTTGNSLDTLSQELGIEVCRHDHLPLVILNYSSFESPRTHPIVRECRGLVLELNSWEVVASCFPRFFNWGEIPEEDQLFDWDTCIAQAKEDGSLGLLYNYKGEWLFNTRGSFADLNIIHASVTWANLFKTAIGINSFNDFNSKLGFDKTYVFELVSPFNQVVRQYPDPAVYLLSTFSKNQELHIQETNDIYKEMLKSGLQVLQPEIFEFNGPEEAIQHLESLSVEDETFEGYVFRDANNNRIKIKSKTYIELHYTRGEGNNLFHPRYQIDWILNGETEEIINYFPLVEKSINEHKEIVENAFEDLKQTWEENWQIEDRKEFAEKIMNPKKCRFFGLLFYMRDKYGKNQNLSLLKQMWKESDEFILKLLFDTKKRYPKEKKYFSDCESKQ